MVRIWVWSKPTSNGSAHCHGSVHCAVTVCWLLSAVCTAPWLPFWQSYGSVHCHMTAWTWKFYEWLRCDCLNLDILLVTAVWLPELRILRPGVAGRFLLLKCAATSYWLDGFTLLQSAAAAQTTAITDHGAKSKVHGSASLSATSTLDLSGETQEKQIKIDRVPPKWNVWKQFGHPVKTKNSVRTSDKLQTVCRVCFTAQCCTDVPRQYAWRWYWKCVFWLILLYWT